MDSSSQLPSPDAPPAPMTDAEVASLAVEVGNLCVDIGRQWEELDSARADLSAEDRGNEREENARIERSHSVMLRKVFDRYRGAAPALPVGRAAPYAWLTKSKATGEWLNWGADKPSGWVTVKNAGLFDVIPLYLAPPVSSRFDRESLAKLIHDGLGWNGLTDWYEKNADHPDIRKCYKAADAILASLTGGAPSHEKP